LTFSWNCPVVLLITVSVFTIHQ